MFCCCFMYPTWVWSCSSMPKAILRVLVFCSEVKELWKQMWKSLIRWPISRSNILRNSGKSGWGISVLLYSAFDPVNLASFFWINQMPCLWDFFLFFSPFNMTKNGTVGVLFPLVKYSTIYFDALRLHLTPCTSFLCTGLLSSKCEHFKRHLPDLAKAESLATSRICALIYFFFDPNYLFKVCIKCGICTVVCL